LAKIDRSRPRSRPVTGSTTTTSNAMRDQDLLLAQQHVAPRIAEIYLAAFTHAEATVHRGSTA
jgi:hypothetical protein